MESTKVVPEYFSRNFNSKKDLYTLMSTDLNYFLPPYDKCPLHFLQKVFSGEKKVSDSENFIRFYKISKISVPRYKELSVRKIWEMIKDIKDLSQYFPDYVEDQLPSRLYLFAILSTKRSEVINEFVRQARSNRSIKIDEEKKNFIEVEPLLLQEIEGVYHQKLTNGRARYLLKKSTKIVKKRKQQKEYQLDLSVFEKKKEETKEHEEME